MVSFLGCWLAGSQAGRAGYRHTARAARSIWHRRQQTRNESSSDNKKAGEPQRDGTEGGKEMRGREEGKEEGGNEGDARKRRRSNTNGGKNKVCLNAWNLAHIFLRPALLLRTPVRAIFERRGKAVLCECRLFRRKKIKAVAAPPPPLMPDGPALLALSLPLSLVHTLSSSLTQAAEVFAKRTQNHCVLDEQTPRRRKRYGAGLRALQRLTTHVLIYSVMEGI